MKPCAPYLYEFLWRGRAPDDPDPPAWHVQIEQRLDAGKDVPAVPHVRTLNVAQAIEAGWDLDQIGATIDTAALAELDQARLKIELQNRALEELRTLVESLNAQLEGYRPRAGEAATPPGEAAGAQNDDPVPDAR